MVQARIERVQARGFDHARREIDGGDCAPARASDSASNPPPQPTSSTRAPRSVARSCDVARAHGIELVQRLELAIDIPEAMRRGLEFGDFRGVAVRANRGANFCGARHEAREL